jgi:hypothetical protein
MSRPEARPQQPESADRTASRVPNRAAVVALVLGAVALVLFGVSLFVAAVPLAVAIALGAPGLALGPLTGVPAVVYGLIGRARGGTGRRTATAGLMLGVLATGLHAAAAYLVWWPGYRDYQRQTAEKLKLLDVGKGFHQYDRARGHLLPAGFGPDDRPRADYWSWRAGLLPYIGQERVANRIDFTQPWNGPTNRAQADVVIPVYADHDASADPQTRYRVFHGGGAMFDVNGQTRLTSVTDGLSNTLMVVDTPAKVPWPQFNEVPYDPHGPLPPLGRGDTNYMMVLMADGSVRVVRKTPDAERVLRPLITRAGGEGTVPD